MRLYAFLLLSLSAGLVVAQEPQPPVAALQGGVVAGHILHSVPPAYPAAAKAAGIEGVVSVKAVLGKDGAVKDAQVVSGPELLRSAAIDAVSQWVYSPYTLNGVPTEVNTTINVRFNLGKAPVRISGGVLQGLSLTKVAPVYPDEARAARISGSVVINVLVGRDGRLRETAVVSGPPTLRDSAITAVRQWTYKPYLLNGEPVEINSTVTVNFNIQ